MDPAPTTRPSLLIRLRDPAEEVPHRRHPQPAPRHAEIGARRRLFTGAEPPGVLEDLADRQVGQQPHREHYPEGDLVRQHAIARVDPSGRRQRLSDGFRTDNLFEARQSIQDPARLIGRERALSSWHASRGLLVASVLSKPKVTGGCDLRPFERYCP